MAVWDTGGESQGKLVVTRLVRMCRIVRFLKGSTKFEASRTTVLVVLTTLTNCKWVLVVVIGFILCVVTLWLNWFGYDPSVNPVPRVLVPLVGCP